MTKSTYALFICVSLFVNHVTAQTESIITGNTAKEPELNFWGKVSGNGVSPDGRFTHYNNGTKYVALDKHEYDGQLLPLRWRDADGGSIVEKNIYRVKLPSSVRESLQDYAYEIGLYDYLDFIFPDNLLEIGTDRFVRLEGELWHNKRPQGEWSSDMHWISPADKTSHDGYLRALGDGNLDTILQSIGEALGLDGLSCYHLTFIVVQSCEKGYVHHDFTKTGAKGFNLIIPMEIVPDAEPELDVVDSGCNSGRLKYEEDVGLLIGDDALHATAKAEYEEDIRLMATVFMADVNESNVHRMEYSQPYPPDDPVTRLAEAGNHWNSNGSGKLPRNSFIDRKSGEDDLDVYELEDMEEDVWDEDDYDELETDEDSSLAAQINYLRDTNDFLLKEVNDLRDQNLKITNLLKKVTAALELSGDEL
mmetsp:Transcript_3063/g.4218  ORF Transcript_3063/g.4218 Transcript_3063/m.4218 type:complete len:420 (-) Transcript_3063:156-1415(-)|eukprot:CAMPEP_0116066736 /NCGR_PEP_ID=MMETSP0322-20121206/10569_1 /TAXON_ID=163516 /ORGANISM="Leptocylindrus danicus var. apora, Strain B651" /LENGTH=419 /DNA_ID=CAMNT_0003553365 /DNA_START=97 /DNA_END=1356 /DNA_ORIENTATION=+